MKTRVPLLVSLFGEPVESVSNYADVDMVVIMVSELAESMLKDIKQNWDKLMVGKPCRTKGKVILDCFNICPLEGTYHI